MPPVGLTTGTANAPAPHEARERTSDPLDQLLERYLYGATLVDRDDARRDLAGWSSFWANVAVADAERRLGVIVGPGRAQSSWHKPLAQLRAEPSAPPPPFF